MKEEFEFEAAINKLKANKCLGIDNIFRRGSRGGEMGEFSPPPLFLSSLLFFFFSYPSNIEIILRKFTPHFKILDPRLILNEVIQIGHINQSTL